MSHQLKTSIIVWDPVLCRTFPVISQWSKRAGGGEKPTKLRQPTNAPPPCVGQATLNSWSTCLPCLICPILVSAHGRQHAPDQKYNNETHRCLLKQLFERSRIRLKCLLGHSLPRRHAALLASHHTRTPLGDLQGRKYPQPRQYIYQMRHR
jgi:hypothetical protein